MTPEPTDAHRKLDVFVGTWHAEGTSYAEGQRRDNPRASPQPWVSDESYEWLPGGFFLLHRWNARAGTRTFIGTEIIGFDSAKGGYFSFFFDNAGNHPVYHVSVHGDVWTFIEAETRAMVTIREGGRSLEFRWEWKNGGDDWLPLCDREARRVG